MKFSLDCVHCIFKQAVEAPKLFTADPAVRERIVRRTAREIAEFDFERKPPELGGILNTIMGEELGVADPYLERKEQYNRLAIEMLPDLRQRIENAPDPFEAAVRLAIAGNVIDFGIPGALQRQSLSQTLTDALERDLLCTGGDHAPARLHRAAQEAQQILYLADNAGEIALDRLLIERLPLSRVTVAVRSGPAINDALIADARAVGLDRIVPVIESGVALPGTPLHLCGEGFRRRFESADLIISKGQGNFETLFGERAGIFFLLMAKCKLVANVLKCSIGDFVIAQ